MTQQHIYPIFERALPRTEREQLLQQKGTVVWLVGLSGSGKSTLAMALEHKLHSLRFQTRLLDGDNLRTGLNQDLGFSEEDRKENLRRTAEVSKLFADAGLITICPSLPPPKNQGPRSWIF